MKNTRGAFPFWLLCLVVLALQLAGAPIASAASFVPTASMGAPRYAHTATLLPNGKVLVAAGGNETFANLSSAEIYDPVAGTWTATGAMQTDRYGHSATLLPNGKVLVAAGASMSSNLLSAELYDPSTGTWSATGALISGGVRRTATLLQNGKVLVTGGDGVNGDKAELYDPTTGTWTATGTMSTTREYHMAALLPNGKVLVVGGIVRGSGVSYLSSTELYDPDTGTWTATGALNVGRIPGSATLLPSGKVLVAGGATNNTPLFSSELYDPATGVWTVTGALQIDRASHATTLLPSGKVLVVGGDNGNTLASAELYDPATGTWTATGAMNTARYNHVVIVFTNGNVLVVGGRNTNYYPGIGYPLTLASAELYQLYPPLLTGQPLVGGDMQFSYLGGIAGNSYALERSLTLAPADWIPQITNFAVVSGLLLYTNTPVASTNNFWRIRSVP